MRRGTNKFSLFLVFATVTFLFSGVARAQSGVTTQTGMLADGATYIIEVPANWNGILFLYSHGYVAPGSKNPPQDIGDPLTQLFMLARGFALAGSSYATTGWAIEQALPDQIAVLDVFNKMVGRPKKTIALGHSLGGMITAGLIQRHPDRFDAAPPMCGVLSGGVATWNTALDSAFAFKRLLGSSQLQIVNIRRPEYTEGQSTPRALGDGPAWFDPASPEPAPTDVFLNSMGNPVFTPPAFVELKPAQYLRPFSGEAEECEFESPCHER